MEKRKETCVRATRPSISPSFFSSTTLRGGWEKEGEGKWKRKRTAFLGEVLAITLSQNLDADTLCGGGVSKNDVAGAAKHRERDGD